MYGSGKNGWREESTKPEFPAYEEKAPARPTYKLTATMAEISTEHSMLWGRADLYPSVPVSPSKQYGGRMSASLQGVFVTLVIFPPSALVLMYRQVNLGQLTVKLQQS